MATVNKDFKIKHGLVVEGTTGTINNHTILTETDGDAYILSLVGGSGTPDNTPNTIVQRDGSGNFAAGTVTASRVNIGSVGYIEDDGSIEIVNTDGDDINIIADDIRLRATDDVLITSGDQGSASGDIALTTNGGNIRFQAADVYLGTNIGFTDAERVATQGYVDNAITNIDLTFNTDDIQEAEGAVNRYFTDFRAQEAVGNNLGTGINYSDQGTGNVLHVDENYVATRTYAEGLANTAQTNAENTANFLAGQAETNANAYTENQLINYTTTANLDSTVDSYGYLKSEDLPTMYSDADVDAHLSGGQGINYSLGEISAHLGNGLEFSNIGEIQVDENIVATQTDLTDAINNHDVATGVHGLAGDVVGTTDTQTISNKTLGSDLAAGGFQITNLGTPQNSTDAATKAYVDAVSEGLHVHAAARVAIQGNISIATGLENGDTAGGVTLATGDRVLVKDQTTASENGIYVVQASGQALRATDFDTATEVASGDFIFVSEGTYANTGWVQTNNPATIGTDPIAFTQFSGAGTYSAGNGLTLDGTEFKINESITATVTYVDTEIGDHASDTATHGVTEIVGASENQTLTNKTLGSSTVLGANLDAANSYTVINLQEPVSNQDAATKFYVDGELSSGLATKQDTLTEGTNIDITGSTISVTGLKTSDVVEDSIAGGLYFTNQRALDATASAYDAAGAAATAESNANDYTDTAVSTKADAANPTLTGTVTLSGSGDFTISSDQNIVIDANTTTYLNSATAGNEVATQGYVDNAISNIDLVFNTDEVSEGTNNLYHTDARAKSAAADLLTNATLSNITITGNGSGLTITAENGVADSDTDDLTEGTTNLYFTDQRAVDALQETTPNFISVELDSIAKQIAATVSAPTAASQITAYSWAKADYRSAKFLVKTAYGTHTELTEVLITLDSSDNIAIVEYATVGTNGSSMAVTADVDGSNVRLRVTPTNNNSTVTVVGTLLV